jgi:hypothetical protein
MIEIDVSIVREGDKEVGSRIIFHGKDDSLFKFHLFKILMKYSKEISIVHEVSICRKSRVWEVKLVPSEVCCVG